MIKLTLREAHDGAAAIGEVMQIRLPVKASYRLSRIAAKLNSELKAFGKIRIEKVKEFGHESPEGSENYVVDEPAKIREFTKAMDELLDVEVEIQLDPLKLEDLGAAEISPASLLACEKFIVE